MYFIYMQDYNFSRKRFRKIYFDFFFLFESVTLDLYLLYFEIGKIDPQEKIHI